MSDVLPCVVCGERLAPMDSGSPNHAHNANEFCTHGQYGSTVFDPLNGDRLAVNICDKCLVAAGDAGRVMFGRHGSRELTPWKRARPAAA